MVIGIDLGTSGVKVVLLNAAGEIIASQTEKLAVSRPQPLWSEQNASDWWQAADRALQALRQQHDLHHVRAIGLSGQMHGATLLDAQHQPLRPAILWNDGRSLEQCRQLEERVPQSRQITGNLMMPGFTAPKLLWVRQHEPEIFSRIAKVLLPKDYLRWRMTGTFASDMSDAAGTMWLDVANRRWSDPLLSACGLTQAQMPQLFEGNQITGYLLPELAQRWGMTSVPVIAGGGDNAAGAVGTGMINAGQAMLSLGTSGVYFVVSDGFLANPESAVHSFCHALPHRWHLMSVMLSAAACLDWAAALTGCADVPMLLAEAEQARPDVPPLFFLPYLSGERTPYNNPQAKGTFFGLTYQHSRPELALAVLEGVGYALAQGIDAVHACGIKPTSVMLIGGGARSPFWRQMLADISGQTLDYCRGGDVGPALGAARLARLALYPDTPPETLLPGLPLEQRHQPDLQRHRRYQPRRELFARLYQQLAPLMNTSSL
ncbi:xylulokinase [Mixta intestinalis]|uniref:Xylulose kinase n=1 Tax=Mixta intestinalis TaxID=1615494 RepID=A0A6P1Q678_9GAMM|nr:xylulokinase [Mixta intestinalis]QHM73285.1 Xylulose kinase [Mixta intestinalis]